MRRLVVACCTLFSMALAQAEDISVAVAANFASPMEEIARAFNRDTGHQLKISTGASGKFYAQIRNGAPFQVFLSADETKPAQLENEGLAAQGTRFTYAIGKLVLWSADPDMVDAKGRVLESGRFNKVAVANPGTAPYGEAAIETLTAMNLKTRLMPKLVMGENISQTYQFVESGNAEIGFVALSQVTRNNQRTSGSMWLVPEKFYTPIKQDVVLLINAKDSVGARQLLDYLKSEAALKIIRAYGYGIN